VLQRRAEASGQNLREWTRNVLFRVAGNAALDADVQPGSTPQFDGKAVPLMLTPESAKHGTFYLLGESLRNYQNKARHVWIAH